METRVKAPLAANRRRALLFVLTLVLPALILLLRPLGFTLQQSVILAATAACRASCSSLFWRTLPAPPGVWCSPSSSPPRP